MTRHASQRQSAQCKIHGRTSATSYPSGTAYADSELFSALRWRAAALAAHRLITALPPQVGLAQS